MAATASDFSGSFLSIVSKYSKVSEIRKKKNKTA